MSGFIVVISGKTCSGKTYLLNQLLNSSNSFTKIVSSTTRASRADEIEGVDYYFMQSEYAEHLINTNAFVESNIHSGNLYGVTFTELKDKLKTGLIPCIILTPDGLERYKQVLKRHDIKILSFYIECPQDVQIIRLAKRTQQDIEKEGSDKTTIVKQLIVRMNDIAGKEKHWDNYKAQFDHVISYKDDAVKTITNAVMLYMKNGT